MTFSLSTRRLIGLVVLTLAFSTFSSASADASTIHWRIDMDVQGTVFSAPLLPGDPPVTIPVPAGTPMSVDLIFDSGTPNTCPPGHGGVYNIGGASGNSAGLHFLGADYSAPGGIETGALGPCGFNANAAGLRLFVGPGPVNFIPTPGFGNFFFTLPPPSDGVSLPTVLPTDPWPTGGSHFGDANTLIITNARITAFPTSTPVPEPGTLGLVALGGLLLRKRLR